MPIFVRVAHRIGQWTTSFCGKWWGRPTEMTSCALRFIVISWNSWMDFFPLWFGFSGLMQFLLVKFEVTPTVLDVLGKQVNIDTCYTSITYCEVWLVENQSRAVQQIRMDHGCTARRVTWVMLTAVHQLDRSHCGRFPALSTKRPQVRGNSEEWFLIWTTVRLLIKLCILIVNNVWRWQHNFEKRNNQLLHPVIWGPWVLYTLRGKWHPRRTPWTSSQHATIVYWYPAHFC